MKVAIEGCAHGELDKIYETIDRLEKETKIKIDLLIICGDFQAVRNPNDLKCMAVPLKYQKLNTFYKYYSGECVAPILTIFVGGNHEASNYLSELYYGGWVCPNIYYVGCANVINVGGIRIGGLSGIFKSHDYMKGHHECPPYDEHAKRSVYHVRNIDVFRLKQIKQPIDIFISHDWPKGVYNNGNKEDLLRRKPFFTEEVNSNQLGSPVAEELLHKLRPSYWFAAHMHCKFAALVPHNIDGKKTFTKFLALDKCLPRRKFLQVLDIGDPNPLSLEIEYDPEWLCILQSTNHLLNTTKGNSYMPGSGCLEQWDFTVKEEQFDKIKNLFNENFVIPIFFEKTAPIFKNSEAIANTTVSDLKPYINPQTTKFCSLLEIKDPLADIITNFSGTSLSISEFSFSETSSTTHTSLNPDEISLSDSDSDINVNRSPEEKFNSDSKSLFFFDSKGTDSKNATTMSTSIESINCSTPISHVKDEKFDFKFPELKETTYDSILKDSDKIIDTPPKKFKRRNELLYKSFEDDQTDADPS